MAVLFDQHLKVIVSDTASINTIRLFCTCASCKADMIIAGVMRGKNVEKYTDMTICPVCHGSLGFNFSTSFGTPADAEENADRYFGQYLSEKELYTLKANFEYKFSEIDRDNIYATAGAKMYTHYSQNGPFDWTYIIYRSSIGVYPIWRHILKMKDEQSVEQKLSTLLSGVLPATALASDTKTKITSSSESLKAFISQLFSVETNIYSLSKRLTDLYMQQVECERNIRRHKGLAELDLRKQTILSEAAYDRATKELSHIRQTNSAALVSPHQPKPSKPEAPVFEKPGSFNKKKVLAHNEQLAAKHQQALAEYEQALANYQHEIEAQYAQALSAAEAKVAQAKAQMEQSTANIDAQIEAACALPSPETVAKQMLDDEITQAEKMLKELIECRNKLYACDVVFIKYRNMVALATFYEYLISGRCTTLEGPNGAYNLFEAECRANQIIGQLNKIVDSLEQIKESQYLIYSQLQSINTNLATMNTTMQSMSQSLQSIQADASNISGYMEKVAQNSDVIAHNTAVSAYYTKMNAELTNSLGYLVALH